MTLPSHTPPIPNGRRAWSLTSTPAWTSCRRGDGCVGSRGRGGPSSRAGRGQQARPDAPSQRAPSGGRLASDCGEPAQHLSEKDGDTQRQSAAQEGEARLQSEPGEGDEYDVFDVGAELAGLMEDDLEELVETFAADAPERELGFENEGLMAEAPIDPSTAVELIDAAAVEAEGAGLGALPEGQGLDAAGTTPATADEATAPKDDAAPTPPVAQPQSERERVNGPSPSGYVWLDGRSVARILRGNPAGSCSVRCYRHTGCSFLLSLRDTPSDADLLQWLFEVPAAAPGSSSAESKSLGRQHVALADRWRSSKKRKSASSSSNAASGAK